MLRFLRNRSRNRASKVLLSYGVHAKMCTDSSRHPSTETPRNQLNVPLNIPQKPVRKDSSNRSIDLNEIAKFSAIAETWWDTKGPFKMLQMMNPTRLSFIRTTLCAHFGRNSFCAKPLDGLNILDVGCGGGLLCEPLSRMGAQVVGIDATEKNIKVATAHSAIDPITESVEYICTTAEELVQEKHRPFDAVISLEVIEHVSDPRVLLHSVSTLTKPGGAVIISTINRSISSYLLAVVADEHLLQWVPKGTHEWLKFVTPDEVALLMSQSGIMMKEVGGMVFNPLTQKWSLSGDTSVNYIAFGTKIPLQNDRTV